MKIRVVREFPNGSLEILWFWQAWIEDFSLWILEVRNYMPEWIYILFTDIGWKLGWFVDDTKNLFPASHRIIEKYRLDG